LQRYEGSKVTLHALRLEAVLPYKHVFIFKFTPPGNDFAVDAVRDRVSRGFPDLFESPRLIEPRLDDLDVEACVFDRANERVLIKCVHLVETWSWKWTSSREKRLEKHERRHPVVITLRPTEKLMTVSFPGYTLGALVRGGQRATYVDIARKACAKLETASDIRASGFPLKQTVELILKKEMENVIDLRRDLKPERGKMMFDSGERTASLPAYVSSIFGRLGIRITESQIRLLFDSTEAADILLWWKKKELLTRVAFHDFAAELLFIWRGTPSDVLRIEEVLKTFVDYQKFVDRNQLTEALEYVDQLAEGTIIRSSALAQQFNLSSNEALDILYRAVQRGVLHMLFRVKTEVQLAEFSNEWRTALSDFPQSVVDENDETIDLTQNSNIEVAFERPHA
jgi:hypothetical protein